MDAREMVVALVTAVLSALTSWPVAILTLGLVFHRPLHKLVGRLSSVKAGGVEATFGDRLGEAEVAVDAAVADAPAPGPQPNGSPSADDRLASAAEASPSLTLLRAWNLFEDRLRVLAFTSGAVARGEAPVGFLLSRLRAINVVNVSFAKAVEDLRRLRNAVAHGQHSPTEGEAIAYLDSAVELTRACEALISIEAQRTTRRGAQDET